MSSDITLSAGVRQNLLALQSTASLLSSTQNRLATGKKVNSALDNPTNFFTSSALSARASDMSKILDSMSNGIQTLQAANNGLTAITNAVNSMQATVTQARQDSSWKSASYTIDSTTIGTSAVKNLSISGGAVGTTAVDIALNTTGTTAHQASVTQAANYVPTTAAASATGPVLDGQNAYAGSEFVGSSGSPSTITVDGQTVTFDGTTDGTTAIADTTTNKYTLTEAISKINSDLGATSSTIQARAGTGANAGKIEFFDSNASNTGSSATITVSGTTAGADGGLGANLTASGTDAVTATSYSFTINGTAISLDSTTGASGSAAATAINSQLSSASVTGITASFASGKLTIAGASDGSNNITIAGTDAATVFGSTLTDTGVAAGSGSVKSVDDLVTAINGNASLTGKVKASNDNGKLTIQNLSTEDLTLTGAGATAVDGSTSTQTVGGNSVRKNLITQFNDLRSQLDKLADDSSFNGINLLHGDTLKLVFNETNTSSISIVSQNANGINSSVLGIGTASSTEFSDNDSLDARADALHNALTQLRSQSSAFGSNLSIVQNRQDFTKNMINTLQVGSDNLTLADSNEEAANLLALQTRQQLSTTALSLASQADQAVLRLF